MGSEVSGKRHPGCPVVSIREQAEAEGRGRTPSSGERAPVSPTQGWCLPPPSLSPGTSGYMMSIAVTSLSNVVPWAYSGALRSFSGFKSTLGRLNIVVTNPSGLRPPNNNHHILRNPAALWRCPAEFSSTPTPICLRTPAYRTGGGGVGMALGHSLSSLNP